MGLDLTEMIMDIEDEFAIAIDDHDASRIETAGQLSDHVVLLLGRTPARQTAPCASAWSFYEVRRALLADRAVRGMRIGPDTTMDELVASDDRRNVVTRLTRKFNLPELPSRFLARTGTREPRPGLRVRDVVASHVRRVPLRFIRGGRVDEAAVWDGLCEIMVGYAGGDARRITRETHIIRDLHLG